MSGKTPGGSQVRPGSLPPVPNWVLFAFLVVIWGFNYLFVRAGLDYSSPLWLATFRAGLGALGVFVLISFLPRPTPLDRAGKRDALLLGLPNTALFFGLWFAAAPAASPGLTAVIIYTFPIWVALFSPWALGSKLSARHWASVALGFAGVAVLSQVWNLESSPIPGWAVLFFLLAAISWALGTVLYQRRFAPSEMQEANLFQLLGGTAVLVAGSLLLEPNSFPSGPASFWLIAVWLGIVGTAIAYAIWFRLLAGHEAARLSAFLFLVPVVALVASAIFLQQNLQPVQLAGVALILASLYGVSRPNPEKRTITDRNYPA